MSNELKPCPKCGGEITIYTGIFRGAFAKCKNCKSEFDICGMDKIPTINGGVKIRQCTVDKIKRMWNRSVDNG